MPTSNPNVADLAKFSRPFRTYSQKASSAPHETLFSLRTHSVLISPQTGFQVGLNEITFLLGKRLLVYLQFTEWPDHQPSWPVT